MMQNVLPVLYLVCKAFTRSTHLNIFSACAHHIFSFIPTILLLPYYALVNTKCNKILLFVNKIENGRPSYSLSWH